MKVLYDWLQEYVGESIPPVSKLEELLTFHAFEIDGVEEVGNHVVLDVKILPDRSSDCLSHRGIAREISSIVGTPFTHDLLKKDTALTPVTEKIRVTIDDAHACTRFGMALMRGVTIGDSPAWLKDRLQALGQRPINNVVDATNYIMLALGQPLHAYDAEKFPHTDEGWHFRVRMAEEGEKAVTLSGDEYTLTPQIQVIADGLTGTVAGLAGVKGGKLAEIDAGTTNIILEAAHFDPQITRKGAQYVKLQTDASKRFENNPSARLIPYALTEVVQLIADIAGGTCDGYIDVNQDATENAHVSVTLTQINGLLGLMLSVEVVESIFNRLGYTYIKKGEEWDVTAPWERSDITIAEDVIADVGRHFGYEHVAPVLPERAPLSEYNAKHYYSEVIRTALVTCGCSEVITSSFRKKDTVQLLNALASDKGCLRSTLRVNIREVLDKNMPNADLLGLRTVAVFEIGTVFEKTEDGSDVTEHTSLAIGARTKQQGYTQKDDTALTQYVEAVESVLGVSLKGVIEHGVYECNLTEVLTTLNAPTAYVPYRVDHTVTFRTFSQYPFISRDIALWTPEGVTADDVEVPIRTSAGTLLTRVTLFDSFAKEGRVSYAFRLIFQAMDRTLTDDEVGMVMESITATMKAKGFEVR